ncbi:ABC transporter substrate-binding protein [Yoonia sp.]|uniref:ABC transporter substrate-binding protein n=1 Tax=Yoonia sp. TaxID=2212373 RepID=UPI0039188657
MTMRIPALFLAVLALPAQAQDFPQTIPHKFGSAEIAAQPDRIATLDFAGADDLLALGVQPVLIRNWYGDYPRAVWPWAEDLLQGAPDILRGDLNAEQVAAAAPDVILSLWSGITDAEYAQLARIAPVVAVPEGVGDYALPWDERAVIAGRAIGREAEAQAQVDAIHQQLADIAAAHPEWQGKTAVTASAFDGTVGAYTSQDVRPQLLEQLGFVTPQQIDSRTDGNDFWVTLSHEDLSPLDADLLIWISSDGGFTEVESLVARPFLTAHTEGHEVLLGKEMSGAFSHASLLSLPFLIDRLVPMIEAALDDDPQTHADDR